MKGATTFEAALQRLARELEGRVQRTAPGGRCKVAAIRSGVSLTFTFNGGSVRVELDRSDARKLGAQVRAAARPGAHLAKARRS